jgi:hypothetical protein
MGGVANIMLFQAQHALRCYTHPEPLDFVSARCKRTICDVVAIRQRQDIEAAAMGRTEHSLGERVSYWQKQCQR